MNIQGIFHEAKSNYSFAYDTETFYIRLRTAKNDMDQVSVIVGDKYDWDKAKEIMMPLERQDEYFDYYLIAVNPNDVNRRLSYIFKVKKEDDIMYFGEWGVVKPSVVEVGDKIHKHYFNHPYVNPVDIHVVPEWVKDAVFYQIFPERFNNGDASLNPENTVAWDSEPLRDNYMGGDLVGIEEKVPYLRDLGINAIYMTPIFEAMSNHKYDTIDYMKIDQQFGDLQAMKSLVKTCHENGIKVVLDAVYNHSGYMFDKFQDVCEKGAESQYKDWFHIHSFPVTREPLNYDTFGFVADMPKLNTENPEVIDYLLKVSTFWIEECDIDGWRLDVSNEIDHAFWRKFREAVKSVKPDAYICGEIWHVAKAWNMGDQFDGTMNYPFTNACLSYFAKQDIDVTTFMNQLNQTIVSNTKQANQGMLNILDSHDTPRLLTECEGHEDRMKLAAAFQMTFEGAPSVYYGSEIGMAGGPDPGCRAGMIWDESKWNKDMFDFYKTVIGLRNNHVALRRGELSWIFNDDCLAYEKGCTEETVLILMNNSDKKVTFNQKTTGVDLVTGVEYTDETIDMPAMAVKFIQK